MEQSLPGSAHLELDYADAWAEWEAAGESELWDALSADGLDLANELGQRDF